MAYNTFQIALSADRVHVVINLLKDRQNVGGLALDASEIEQHIAVLANARAMLSEQVPMSPEPNARVVPVSDPSVVTALGKTPSALKPLLALRHPGMGWLSFMFSADQARDLAGNLREKADQAQKG